MTTDQAQAQLATDTNRIEEAESFEAFKKSFAYGKRNDLLFKFIKNLSNDDASKFFQDLLERLGDTLDDGNFDRIIEHVFDWNVRSYAHETIPENNPWAYDEGPFAPMTKPLSECTLGLLTATGHFVEGDDPEPFGVKNMTQQQAIPRIGDFIKAAPKLSTIPVDVPRDKLRVRHPGYDIRAVQKDYNVGLPLDHLCELERDGVIGQLLPDAFSFVGATAQRPLTSKHAPQWADMLKERQVDAMLLVPA